MTLSNSTITAVGLLVGALTVQPWEGHRDDAAGTENSTGWQCIGPFGSPPPAGCSGARPQLCTSR
jgi:hypothetical protein